MPPPFISRSQSRRLAKVRGERTLLGFEGRYTRTRIPRSGPTQATLTFQVLTPTGVFNGSLFGTGIVTLVTAVHAPVVAAGVATIVPEIVTLYLDPTLGNLPPGVPSATPIVTSGAIPRFRVRRIQPRFEFHIINVGDGLELDQ